MRIRLIYTLNDFSKDLIEFYCIGATIRTLWKFMWCTICYIKRGACNLLIISHVWGAQLPNYVSSMQMLQFHVTTKGIRTGRPIPSFSSCFFSSLLTPDRILNVEHSDNHEPHCMLSAGLMVSPDGALSNGPTIIEGWVISGPFGRYYGSQNQSFWMHISLETHTI